MWIFPLILSRLRHQIRCILLAHFDYARLRRIRLIAIEEVRNHGKILYIENIYENGWLQNAYPSSIPLDPPLAISYTNHQKGLAYFSYLVSLILFSLLKGRVKKGGGGMAQCPLNTLLTGRK